MKSVPHVSTGQWTSNGGAIILGFLKASDRKQSMKPSTRDTLHDGKTRSPTILPITSTHGGEKRMPPSSQPIVGRKLLPRTTCPHCWTSFAPEETLFISAHADLLGDPRLGSDQQQRFRPTRFDLAGNALDAARSRL